MKQVFTASKFISFGQDFLVNLMKTGFKNWVEAIFKWVAYIKKFYSLWKILVLIQKKKRHAKQIATWKYFRDCSSSIGSALFSLFSVDVVWTLETVVHCGCDCCDEAEGKRCRFAAEPEDGTKPVPWKNGKHVTANSWTQKYFPLIWMDKIFFLQQGTLRRGQHQRGWVSAVRHQLAPGWSKNEWTVRLFQRAGFCQVKSWRFSGGLFGSQIKSDNASLIPSLLRSADRMSEEASGLMDDRLVWMTTAVLGDKGDSPRAWAALGALSLCAGTAVTHSPLPAWAAQQPLPQSGWNTHFISSHAQLSGGIKKHCLWCFMVYWHFSTVFLITIFQSWLIC